MPLAVEEQLTMRELLDDPIFKAWMKKIPSLGTAICTSGKPWRVWVQKRRGGKWARKDFKTYREAYVFMRGQLHFQHDVALTCKVAEFKPPVVKDKLTKKRRYHIPAKVGQNEKHEWCPHCRRPTVFTWFSKHHSFGRRVKSNERRCAICGIRLVAVRHYK